MLGRSIRGSADVIRGMLLGSHGAFIAGPCGTTATTAPCRHERRPDGTEADNVLNRSLSRDVFGHDEKRLRSGNDPERVAFSKRVIDEVEGFVRLSPGPLGRLARGFAELGAPELPENGSASIFEPGAG